jgi:putative peptidoglycan lipid II flippase
MVLVGMAAAAPFVAVLQPGWLADAARVAAGEATLDRYALAVTIVRLTFPMTGFLVLSAWALGVLNSHRRFLLSYFAPVAWNAAILIALFAGAYSLFDHPFGAGALETVAPDTLSRLLIFVFVGALVGGLLQFLVQLPTTLRVMRGFRPSLSLSVPGVKEALRAFGPVVLGRGAYQLSGYLDVFLSSFLAAGALGALGNAQTLYLLPISLFGMSVAASELPELSRISSGELHGFLDRVSASLRQILYLVVPTTVGYLAFGVLLVGALFQTGRFGEADTWLVYLVLAGYTLGLAATTASRLLQNAFYALGDTKTPARLALWRVGVSGVLGAALMLALDRIDLAAVVPGLAEGAGRDPLRLGAVGLAAGSAVGAWVELFRLVAALRRHDAAFRLPWGATGRMAGLALGAAVPAALLWAFAPLGGWPVWLGGALVLAVYGLAYLAAGHVLDLPESDAWLGRVLRKLPGRRRS